MSRRIREHLRSNVVGYVAIFLFAIGGTAYATHPGGANTISSGDIINGEVQTLDIAPSAVTAGRLASNSVNGAKVTNESLSGVDVAADSLEAGDLAAGSVGTSEIADQTVTGTDLAGTGFGNNGFNGDEEIIDGSITGFDIGSNELGGGHIADGSLSGADIADGSLSGADTGVASGAAQNAAVVTLAGGGTDVVSASITTTQTSRIVINGTAELTGADADERAQCFIKLDGGFISLGYETTFDDIGANNEATVAANSFASSVAPGAHTVTMTCFPLAGTIVKDDAGINAIAIP